MRAFWLERLARWICGKFGHSTYMTFERDEICKRCNVLVSTTFSRKRDRG